MHEVAQVLWQVIADCAMLWLWYPANVFLRPIPFKNTARLIALCIAAGVNYAFMAHDRLTVRDDTVVLMPCDFLVPAGLLQESKVKIPQADGFVLVTSLKDSVIIAPYPIEVSYHLVTIEFATYVASITLKCCDPYKMFWRLIGMLDQMVSSNPHSAVIQGVCHFVGYEATPTVLEYLKHLKMLPPMIQLIDWMRIQYVMYISVTQGEFQVPADIANNIKKHVIKLIYKSGVRLMAILNLLVSDEGQFSYFWRKIVRNQGTPSDALVKINVDRLTSAVSEVLEKADPDASLRSYCGQMALIRRVYWDSFKVQDGKVALN
ncbi:hypothetical protein MIR68_000405 [Amoeboaphelidium protococcarum]|nr:hypothetical protein MIR68_000405 [Amoeboaphelidium protococcarum]